MTDTCRICLEGGDLISPCNCSGTSAFVHEECLVRWLRTSKRTNCEICLYEYEIVEVRRKKCRCCPRVEFSESPQTSSTVKFIGFFILFPSYPLAFYSGFTVTDASFAMNIAWAVLVMSFMYKTNTLTTMTFWKLCICAGATITSFKWGGWDVILYDYCVLFLISIFTYVSLVVDSRKQVEHRINIESTLQNEGGQVPAEHSVGSIQNA